MPGLCLFQLHESRHRHGGESSEYKSEIKTCYKRDINENIDLFQDVFCSEICLQEAMEFFHLRESELIDVINELDLTKSEWNAAFRAILRQPLSYFLEHRKEIFTKFDNKYGVELEKGETYMSDDYKAMVNLVCRVPPFHHCNILMLI